MYRPYIKYTTFSLLINMSAAEGMNKKGSVFLQSPSG
jgi:hypothetical protein